MPIQISAPQNLDLNLYQLLTEILRRAVDGSVVLPPGGELTYVPTNATTSGRKYRIQVMEVTDPDTLVISPVLTVTLVS